MLRPKGPASAGFIRNPELLPSIWRCAERRGNWRGAGEMRVGIVADHPPFAYLTASGDPDGLDAALAQEIARRLKSRC